MNVATIVGVRLHLARKDRGLSMRQLAEELADRFETKWDQAKISRIESGKRDLKITELLQAAAVIRVHPLSLLLPIGTDTIDGLELTSVGMLDWFDDYNSEIVAEQIKEVADDLPSPDATALIRKLTNRITR